MSECKAPEPLRVKGYYEGWKWYWQPDVDALLAEKDARIVRLREALELAAARFGSFADRMAEEVSGSYEGYADEAQAGHDEARRALKEAEP